ncbi:MAG: Omp28-related outer membrane protein [Bacteroidota bacterium]
MKRIFMLSSCLLSAYLSAQTFSDNFDSYTAGQKLAQQSGGAWTTWSNQPGGAEDGVVSSANASSMPNSMYFSSTLQTGGPVDQVRNFGVLNTGSFSMSMNLFVETGKAAYFNLQRNATIGQVWAADFNFNDDASLSIVNLTGLDETASYPQNVWFNFRLDINFNSNTWEVYIDNNLAASFSNSENQIASIDIFPVDQVAPYASGFYLDDFEYTVTPYVLPPLNLAANLVSVEGAYLSGSNVQRKLKVRNLGTTAISSFDITYNYNGADETQNVTGLNLASLAETEISFTTPMTLVAGSNVLTATVSNVNGNLTDGDANDDVATITLDPIVPAAGKVVIGEEGTGTWCGWCPRGAVYMEKMAETYGDNWIGIAVHNGDPMTVTEYDAGIGTLIGGYPSALVDRGTDTDPSAMEADFLLRITQAPKAFINNTATFQPISRTLTVTVSADFQAAANSSYKLACVLVEDSVTGTGTGYNQNNYYAGGGNGEMGGFESLPSSVPAAQMVYNHVARAIEPDFNGMENSFPAVVNMGETHSQQFTFVLPAGWDTDQMHIVGLLFDPNGDVDNAGKIDFSAVDVQDEFVFQCPDPVTQYFTADGNFMPDFNDSVFTATTCMPNNVTYTQSPAAGTTLSEGVNTVTFMASDECGNTTQCTFNVTYVADQFTLQCPGPLTLNFSSNGNLMPDFSDSITPATHCTQGNVTYTQNPAAGTTLTAGTTAVTVSAADGCGNTTACTFNLTFVNNVSIAENTANAILFFPNPTDGAVHFSAEMSKICSVSVSTIDGKVIATKSVQDVSGEISLAGFNSGLYILEFTMENGSKSAQQLIKN